MVLLCGARNVGKSSFARLLLNRALSEGAKRLRFLECDLGQSEFTPPGLVALHDVAAPCLGPPHTHLRPPRSCRFIGHTSPTNHPTQYVACVAAMMEAHKQAEEPPRDEREAPAAQAGGQTAQAGVASLVVNTCGWVTGMGGELLADIVRVAAPTHLILLEQPEGGTPPTAALDVAAGFWTTVVRLPALSTMSASTGASKAGAAGEGADGMEEGDDGDEEDDEGEEEEEEEEEELEERRSEDDEDGAAEEEGDVEMTPVADAPTPAAKPRRPAAPPSHESRNLQLLAYFDALPPCVKRLPGDPNAYMNQNWQEALIGLLARAPIAVPLSSLRAVWPHKTTGGEPLTRSDICRVLNASFVALLRPPADPQEAPVDGDVVRGWASHECVGLALVRSVDAKSGLLFIVTPVPHEKLEGVCVFARAMVDLPIAMLQPTALTNPSPYLGDGLEDASPGGKRMQSRNNLERGPTKK